MNKAVILTAGRGNRMGKWTGRLPKCLLRIGATSIIQHQVRLLRRYGIDDVTVVVGYQAEQVKRVLGDSVHYVENPIYTRTNSLYSFWLARRFLGGGFLLLNGDLVFHPVILERLLRSPRSDVLTVWVKQNFEEEEMKVALSNGRVTQISKELRPQCAGGENLGLMKFSGSGAEVLLAKVEELVREGEVNQWFPRAVDAMAPEYPIHAVVANPWPWIEIDFPDDLRTAVTSIYPQIERSAA